MNACGLHTDSLPVASFKRRPVRKDRTHFQVQKLRNVNAIDCFEYSFDILTSWCLVMMKVQITICTDILLVTRRQDQSTGLFPLV